LKHTWKQGLLAMALMSAATTLLAGELEEALNRYYAALGDLHKLENLKSFRLKGAIKTQNNTMPFTFMLRGDMCRVDWRTPEGVHIVQIFDGKHGWEINPILGSAEPRPLDRRKTQKLMHYLDIKPLVRWREKGNQVSYLGRETLDGQAADKIMVRTAQNLERVLFISVETGLPLQFVESSAQGKDREACYKISGYQKVDGVQFYKGYSAGAQDHCVTGKQKLSDEHGHYREVVYTDIELNPELPEFLFCIQETKLAMDR